MKIMLRFLPALFLLLAFIPAATAHPLPTGRYDRTIAVRLTPDGVVVKYTLEVTWFALNLDWARKLTPEEIGRIDRSQRGLAAACTRLLAAEITSNLKATSDGKPLVWRVEKVEIETQEHAVYRITLRADWPPGAKARAFAVVDETFDGKPAIVNLTLDREKLGDGLTITDSVEPPARYRGKPLNELKPEEAAEARRASADVVLPREIAGPNATVSGVAPVATPEPTFTENERPGLLADLWRRGLPALFDSGFGIGVLLLAAGLFGAAHAFTPGHGKTLVAAYLVGERGTVGHAVLLAVTTTIAHTGSVLAVAAVLWGVYGNDVPGTTQGVLQFLGGFLVAAVGLWLLLRRVTGQADHFHLFAGHDHHHHHGDGDHHHHHGPPPETAKTTGGWVRLVLMGFGGGLVPCWDAVLLLLAAIALNRVGFAIPVLVAFSTGLGAVLVMLGVGVVYAHRAGAVKFKESRWFRYLPVVSAVLLIGIGFWLCQEGLRAAVK
jgi:ABC-type nickel/cobalt efflux system permease component RcnA